MRRSPSSTPTAARVGCAAAAVDARQPDVLHDQHPAPGTYHFKAVYSGNAVLAGSESDPATGGITVDRGLRRGARGWRVGRIDLPGEGRLPRHGHPVRQSRRVDRRHDQHLQQQQQAGSPRHEVERDRFLLVRVERTRQQGCRAPGRQVPHRPEARRHLRDHEVVHGLCQPVDEEARHRDQDDHQERIGARRFWRQGLEVRDVRAPQGRQQRRARRVAVQDPVGRDLQVAVVPGQRVGPAVGARVDHRDAELQPVRQLEHRLLRSVQGHWQLVRLCQVVLDERLAVRPPQWASPCAAWSASSRAPSTCTRPRSR